jgi:predicted acetyltransferase
MKTVYLIEPSIDYKEEYVEMIKEWEVTGEVMVPFVLKFE